LRANHVPLILSVETATRAGSVVVARGDSLLATRVGDASVSHSAHLLRQVREALEEAGSTLAEVDLFAVATGPGSFTGLRIGLATVKSFAATLGRLCAGVPTLHAVAHAAGTSTRTLALLPAGRGELFAQVLTVEGPGRVAPQGEPAHLTPQGLLEKVKTLRTLRWAGEGTRLHAETIKAFAAAAEIQVWDELEQGRAPEGYENGWTLAPASKPLAGEVAVLSLNIWGEGGALPPERLQALYVRPSDAEINETCRT
jgi:tRNA threonylcarbamoyladenosine biosynthesis protein TsaB